MKSKQMKNSMFKITLTLLLVSFSIIISNAQISINSDGASPDASAMLEVTSSDKGLLIPRMTETERDAIANPAQGLLIYNTDDDCFNYYTGIAWYKDCGRDLTADVKSLTATTQSIGGTGDEEGKSITVDSDGNILVAGTFTGTLTIGDSTFTSGVTADIWLVKYDSDYNFIWAKHISEIGSLGEIDIISDSDNNVYLSSDFSSTVTIEGTTLTPVTRDVLLSKYDKDGNFIRVTQTGCDNKMYLTKIDIDDNDNVYVAGYFVGNATFGSNSLSSTVNDAFLAQCDENGSWQWGVQSISTDYAEIYNLKVKGSGVYISGEMEGTTTFGTTSFTIPSIYGFVAKYNTSGVFQWAEEFTSSSYASSYGVTVDNNDDVIITGFTEATSVIGDSTFVISGGAMFLTKYNSTGVFEWAKIIESANNIYGEEMIVDNDNNIIVLGSFIGSADFDGTTVTSTASTNAIISTFDTDGNFIWIEHGGTINAYEIAIDDDEVIHIIGRFSGTATFGDDSFTSLGSTDILFLQYNSEDGSQTVAQNGVTQSQDGDTDASNEIQDISLSGTTLSLSSGSSVDLSGVTTDTDNQTVDTFSLSGNDLQLSLEDDGQSVQTIDLSSFLDNTDDQILSLSNTTLTLENGGSIDLSSLLDNTDDQTVDVFSLSGNNLQLSLEGDGQSTQSVDLSSFLDNTDDQTVDVFSLSGNNLQLSLEDDGQSTQSVDLSSFLDNTDDQALSLSSTTLTLEDGGNVDLTSFLDNTDDQALSLSSTTLTLEDGGNVDLSSFLDNTDDQIVDVFSLSGNNLQLSLENDGQSTQSVDLSSFLDNTDDQALSLSSTTLTLEDGGSVDLSGLLDNTDDQIVDVFSLSGNSLQLSLENDGQSTQTVDLSGLLDNTDDQIIDIFSLLGNSLQLSLENDGQSTETVDLSSLLDNTDDQTINVFSLSGNSLQLSLEDDGESTKTVDLSSLLDDTDDQTINVFSLSGNSLQLSLEDDGESTLTLDMSAISPLSLSDTDGDTKIQVEESSNDDIIRFDLGGTEYFNFHNGRIEFENSSNSVSIGEDAGLNNQGLKNVFIGYQTGLNNTSGYNNVFSGSNAGQGNTTGYYNISIGQRAGYANSDGIENVYIGSYAGFYNTGSQNVFIGNKAGYYETGSDKLYIDNSDAASPLIYGDFSSNVLELNGDVGIGTTPTNGKFEVNGSLNNAIAKYTYLNNSNANTVHIASNSSDKAVSIYASERIVGKYVISMSDERIKDIKGLSNNKADLDILTQIEITDYEFIDKVKEGNTKQKKVIAQQVAKVYPQAINKQFTEVVPDIYQKGIIQNGWVELKTNLKVGDRVQIIFDDKKEILEVLETKENAFRVETLHCNVCIEESTVFIYGKQVDDFHTVDYEAISMLNVSATQQLAKENEVLKKEIELLKAQVEKINALEAKLEAFLNQ